MGLWFVLLYSFSFPGWDMIKSIEVKNRMGSHNLGKKIVKLLTKCWRSSIGTFLRLNQKEKEEETKEWKIEKKRERKRKTTVGE